MRASGILMPVFSLPGPFVIGTLGSEAVSYTHLLIRGIAEGFRAVGKQTGAPQHIAGGVGVKASDLLAHRAETLSNAADRCV